MRSVPLVIVMATALVIAAFATAAPAAAGNRPIPGAQYSGTIVDTSGVCDEGQITLGNDFVLQISDYGWTITSIRVSEVTVAGLLTDPQDFTLSVNASVGSSGAFSFDIRPISQILVHTDGVFEGDAVSGSFRVEMNDVLECGGTFSGTGFPPTPRETVFRGEIESGSAAGCTSGTISITRSADRLSVLAIEVGSLETGTGTAAGRGLFDPTTVPVSPADGTFSAYFPGSSPGQEIAVSGRFFEGRVSGAVEVSPSTCGPRTYSAFEGTSDGPGEALYALPSTGSGPPSRGASPPGWLALALAALGAIGLATGFSTRHKTRS